MRGDSLVMLLKLHVVEGGGGGGGGWGGLGESGAAGSESQAQVGQGCHTVMQARSSQVQPFLCLGSHWDLICAGK